MIFWIFVLILSLIVEVYLWWKLQASLIFLSGRTCTIGGWLNTFLPHCRCAHRNWCYFNFTTCIRFLTSSLWFWNWFPIPKPSVCKCLLMMCVTVFIDSQSTEYKGEYWADHPTIKIFWEVFHELPLEKKKQFLCKWTLFEFGFTPCPAHHSPALNRTSDLSFIALQANISLV